MSDKINIDKVLFLVYSIIREFVTKNTNANYGGVQYEELYSFITIMYHNFQQYQYLQCLRR